MRCGELDIFKIRNFLRNSLKFFWIYSGFFGGIFWIFLFLEESFLEDFFGEDFFGRIFLEEFFGGFFGEDFWGGFFWEEFFVYIVKVS